MADKEQLSRILASMKGLAGSGNVLSYLVNQIDGLVATMEPGDFVRSDTGTASAAPLATDLWYLFTHANFMARYFDPKTGTPITPSTSGSYSNADADHYDYRPYMAENLSFLTKLPGLKPLKVLRDLAKQLSIDTALDVYDMKVKTQYQNNGIYWINTLAFELWTKGIGARYASDGPKDFNPNDYVGYISFPIGQLGIMEVISLMQETKLSGYKFTAVDALPNYYTRAAVVLQDRDKPSLQSEPGIFPDMKDGNGNVLAGENYCYGRHLVERGYLVPETPVAGQNTDAPAGETVCAASRDVELFSSGIKDYGEDVKPKFWMRYWIHKDSTFPVPGEFIGILCRPVACPPHVWWFQESSPFLYAGNWMETGNLTSGVVTKVILEEDRNDDGIGNQYYVKIQGCEVIIDSSDFFSYAFGDRVAVLKLDSTATPVTVDEKEKAKKSFAWLDQPTFKNTDKLKEPATYVIIPATFYKKITGIICTN